MPGDTLYERDFYTWTQDQAARLRELTGHNRLDVQHLAEEIADLGRSQVSAVRQHLRQMLVHLIKAAIAPDATLRAYWLSDVLRHHSEALDHYSPGVRQHLDVAPIWTQAIRQANLALKAYGDRRLPTQMSCPVALEDLLHEDFGEADTEAQIRIIRKLTDGYRADDEDRCT